ncbi:MAG TPA: hypothetical protein VFC31_15940 [Candidatus Limnocylindria bacterium]|nr:hypothetical protein [Candidatus Limnocylindria bacterium]
MQRTLRRLRPRSRQLLRALLVAVLVASSTALPANKAYAYCGGLTSYAGFWGSGGNEDFTDSQGLTEVDGYVQGQLPDPVVNVSTAWYMLSRATNHGVFAQGGWVRRAGWSTYYVMAAWTDTSGSYSETYQYVTPSLSHYYGVRLLNGTTAYDFSYDRSSWLDTVNLGWTPSEVQAAGETHNHGDHFPGSAAPGPYVEFWGSTHTVSGLGYSNSFVMIENLSSTDVVGKTQLSGNDFYVWDKRCTDG